MTQVQSNPFRVEIVDPPAGFPPYTLPGPGQTFAIGTNTDQDIWPSGEMAESNWYYSLYNNFGGGAFVSSYSQGGAFVWAGTGGHGVPPNVGAAIFDFFDATWKRRDPPASQGGTTFYRDADYDPSETSGSPHFEINGSNGVPTPAHTYRALCEIPTSLGGGPKGSVINVMRGALTTASLGGSTSHRIDLDTGLWTRAGSIPGGFQVTHSGQAVLDTARSRIWVLNVVMNIQSTVLYYDLTDNTFKQTASTAILFNDHAAGAAWLHQGLLFRQGNQATFFCYNPDTNTWHQLSVTGGTMPGGTGSLGDSEGQNCGFVYYPPTGKFYHCGDVPGSTLTTLTPPANLISGTWTLGSSTVSPALPTRYNHFANDGVHHMNNLFYVPSIQRLAWVPGGDRSVYLINPT